MYYQVHNIAKSKLMAVISGKAIDNYLTYGGNKIFRETRLGFVGRDL